MPERRIRKRTALHRTGGDADGGKAAKLTERADAPCKDSSHEQKAGKRRSLVSAAKRRCIVLLKYLPGMSRPCVVAARLAPERAGKRVRRETGKVFRGWAENVPSFRVTPPPRRDEGLHHYGELHLWATVRNTARTEPTYDCPRAPNNLLIETVFSRVPALADGLGESE